MVQKLKGAGSFLKSLNFQDQNQNFGSSSTYKFTFPSYQKICKVVHENSNPNSERKINSPKTPSRKLQKWLETSQEKSSFRSPSDAAYKSPNPSINYRPPSVSVPYAISAKKYGFCQTNVKMRRQKENMLIYQMPTFLQNRELSRANRLIACRILTPLPPPSLDR